MQARAVVLATGYSDRLHKRSTGTREMSADGIAMAWRAGATLVNMEMQWWHTNDIADPPTWQRMQVYPNPMLGSEKSARMVNSAGEEFFNQQQDDPLAFGPYTVQLKALAKQVHAGKARYDGGYYAGFDHCDPAEVEAYTTYAQDLPPARPANSRSNWSRPPSPRTTGKAASTSIPRPCARRCPGSTSPAASADTATG